MAESEACARPCLLAASEGSSSWSLGEYAVSIRSDLRSTAKVAAPPDGSRGSRSASGSRRLSHIRQSSVFSLPCLGVYHGLRTQVTLTPATFRLPHPRPSARLGSEAGEPTGAREQVCGPDVILTASVKGAREISAGRSPLAQQVARAVRARQNHVGGVPANCGSGEQVGRRPLVSCRAARRSGGGRAKASDDLKFALARIEPVLV